MTSALPMWMSDEGMRKRLLTNTIFFVEDLLFWLTVPSIKAKKKKKTQTVIRLSDGVVSSMPIIAAVAACLKSDQSSVASGTEHINGDRCLGHNITGHHCYDSGLNIKTA